MKKVILRTLVINLLLNSSFIQADDVSGLYSWSKFCLESAYCAGKQIIGSNFLKNIISTGAEISRISFISLAATAGPMWLLNRFNAINEASIIKFQSPDDLKKEIIDLNELTESATEYIANLKLESSFKDYGIEVNKNLFLTGPSGNGKTTTVKKIALELGAYFAIVTPAHLGNAFINQGVLNIEKIFKEARQIAKKKNKLVILFFDDYPFRDRRMGLSSNNNEEAKTDAQLLKELDTINNSADKKVIAAFACNYPGFIDSAIKRRFEQTIIRIQNPDLKKQIQIIKYYANKKYEKLIPTKRADQIETFMQNNEDKFKDWSCDDVRLFTENVAKKIAAKILKPAEKKAPVESLSFLAKILKLIKQSNPSSNISESKLEEEISIEQKELDSFLNAAIDARKKTSDKGPFEQLKTSRTQPTMTHLIDKLLEQERKLMYLKYHKLPQGKRKQRKYSSGWPNFSKYASDHSQKRSRTALEYQKRL